MFSQTALISLACLLSTGEGDPAAIAKLTENLSPSEIAYIDAVQKNGACLPDRFKNLLQRTVDTPPSGEKSAPEKRPGKDARNGRVNPPDAQAGVKPSSDY
jgi:hypothetical protein